MEIGNRKLETGNRRSVSVVRLLTALLCVCLISNFQFPVSALYAQKRPPKAPAQQPPAKAPEEIAAQQLELLDGVFRKAIADDELPGAAVLVSWRGETIFRRAYGDRAILPAREAMTLDTIFDLASLTKILATTSSVMKLVERGRVRLNDPAARYVPEFAPNGKDQVTIRQLLTHTSGLRPIPTLPPKWQGTEAVLKAIYDDTLFAPPGSRFVYSDTGFILLGEIVRRASGLPLEEFALRNIFQVAGMKETRFLPPEEWRARIAPTEEVDLPGGAQPGSGRGRLLRGVVHDPRARGMGGVAGHAGLFSTLDDVALFCRMILSGGMAPNGARVFSANTVALMTSVQTPSWSPTLRGLGWDIDSAYSAPRGEFFPVGSFGHTGFTGTSMWLDPQSQSFVIILSTTQHPYPRPAISSLRSRVATAVAAALGEASGGQKSAPTSAISRSVGAERQAARNGRTKTGIDVLVEQHFAALRGKRVGLITNHTGRARNGRTTIDLLAKAEGV
jgi:CubicO group peptidase (beta-lactamase class C family)